MMTFPIYGKKNVPSHQPVYLCVALKKHVLKDEQRQREGFFHALPRNPIPIVKPFQIRV
jgi:hypothetical protein